MASVISRKPPVAGWNALDSLAGMAPEYAIKMENLVPEAGFVRARGGHIPFSTGFSSNQITTLAVWRYGGSQKLIAAGGGFVWDATTPDSPATLGSLFNSARWETVNFNSKLLMVNGEDTPQAFDGTTLGDMTITGPTPENLAGVLIFKGRAIYWEAASASFWYAAAGAYQGALSEFDLSTIGKTGGNIKFMFSWTRDAGDGIDDFLVIVLDTGECFMYQGSDPSDANDWAIVGRYKIAEPVNIRGHAALAGDEVILTRGGWQNWSNIFQLGELTDQIGVGRIISREAKAVANQYKNNNDWQCYFSPSTNFLIVNVPISSTTKDQHVMNTNTSAWCKFTQLAANCWIEYQGKLLFGGNDAIYQAEAGTSDNGTDINFDCIPAWDYLSIGGRKKQLTAIRLTTNYTSLFRIGMSAKADFVEPKKPSVSGSASSTGGEWDDGEWDSALWGTSDGITTSGWRNISTMGYAIGYRVLGQISQQTFKWYSTDLMFKTGGYV